MVENKNTTTFISYKISHSTFGIQVGKHIAVVYTAGKRQPLSFLHSNSVKDTAIQVEQVELYKTL